MFGDIVLCQFPFTSGTGSKLRPALVLFDLARDCVLCRVTSTTARGPLDVTLADWRSAGLLKPSVAVLDRLVTAERSIVLRRLGGLSPADLAAVRSLWNQHMRL